VWQHRVDITEAKTAIALYYIFYLDKLEFFLENP